MIGKLPALAATADGVFVPIEVSIADLALLIRELTPEQRGALAAELEAPIARKPRCPSHEPGGSTACVRDEDHSLPHVGVDGSEWFVALRCRIGMTSAGAVCDRLDGHEPPCRPRERPGPPAAPPMPAPASPASPASPARPEKGPRGVCRCGKPRQNHDGAMKTGGCAASGCEKYKSAIR